MVSPQYLCNSGQMLSGLAALFFQFEFVCSIDGILDGIQRFGPGLWVTAREGTEDFPTLCHQYLLVEEYSLCGL